MSDGPSTVSSPSSWDGTSRRRLLAFLGAGGVATFASLFSRNEARAAHDGTNVLHLGEFNNAPAGSFGGGTLLVTDAPGRRALDVRNSGAGGDSGAVQAWSRGAAPAVQGNAVGISNNFQFPPDGDGVGVAGLSGSGSGVFGGSNSGPGITGASQSGAGVRGYSDTGVGGDFGGGGPGKGVRGESGTGVGVEGTSEAGVGVEAFSHAGIALKVRGKAAFTTVGSAVISEGEDSAFVPNAAVTAVSHISVTLTSDPGSRTVAWVERNPGSGFTVHLSRGARRQTSLTYLIVEPG
jgi:hypothetical protein